MRVGKRGGRCLLGVVAPLFAALAGTSRASAAELKWSGPSDCDRANAVSDQVESLVGRPLAAVQGLSFAVEVTREGDDWTLELETTRGTGTPSTRTLQGKSCTEVSDAAAVVIGLSIRDLTPAPEATGQPAPKPSAEKPTPPAEKPASQPRPAAPPPNTKHPARSARSLATVVTIAGVLDTASLPGPAPGVALSGGIRYGGFAFEAQGTFLVPNTLDLSAGRSAEFNLFAGALFACLAPGAGTVTLLGCAGFELGSLSGEGHGITEPKLGSALWDALRLEIGGELPVSPSLRLGARVGVAVPVSRPEFQLDGQVVYQPAPLGVRAALGVEFWP